MFNWKAEIVGDRMRFLGEEYPLGHFCLELLQRAHVHDAAARVGVLWDYLDQHLRELQNGLIPSGFMKLRSCFYIFGKSKMLSQQHTNSCLCDRISSRINRRCQL